MSAMRDPADRPTPPVRTDMEWRLRGHGQSVTVQAPAAPLRAPDAAPERADDAQEYAQAHAAAPAALLPAPSLEDLYRDYFQFVWRSARRLGIEQAALDDVVQDVFVVVQRQLPSYEPRRSPRSWLFSITRRVAADHRRTLRRKGGLLPLHEDAPGPDRGGPLRDAMNKQRSDVILAFLGSLDDMHREAFILCELEQLSAPEIADAVSASTSAVYSRIRTARQAFVAYVRDHHPELMGDADG
jgi:RNA polymerase sigma-70 factor (ECF subfamily)